MTCFHKRKLQRIVLAAALSSTSTIAFAQTESPADQPPEANDNVIIVTAQKREQSTLDVGISVTVAGAEAIRERNIEAASELVSFTPNVSVKEQTPGLVPVVTIRGIGLNDFSSTNNPATGVYVDEVSLSSLALLSADLFDLERLEVLKGPQGTLYGRNSTAGALNIISARPKFNGTSGRITAGLANYETKQFEAIANLPVSDTLALRFSGKTTHQDEGFYTDLNLGRDVGRREVWLGRAQALWQPSSQVEVLLKAEVQSGRSELGSAEFFGALPTATETNCPGQPGCSNFFGYTDTDGDPFVGSYSVDPTYNFDQTLLTAIVTADLGFADLTSVTGFIDFERIFSPDVDASPLRITDFTSSDEVQQFSQELRLSGDSDLLSWQVGVFYARDEVQTVIDGSLQDLFNTTTFTSADQESKSYAVFGNAEWALSDTLSVITGLRLTNEKRSNVGFTQDNVSEPGGSFLTMAPFGAGPIVLGSVDDSISNTSLSWKVGLNWKPSPDMLVFASASESDKSGGFFSGIATSDAQLVPYDREKLRAYELGMKGSVAGDLTYEVVAFYYDYSDVQTFIQDTIGTIPVQRLGNVDEAEVYGADISLNFRPDAVPGLNLSGAIGLLSTELGTFQSGSGPVPKGNRLPDAPKFSANFAANYETDISADIALRFGLNARYQSDAFTNALNTPLLLSEGYWVLGANASVFSEGNWEVSAWAKNLANKNYVTQGLDQLVFGGGYRIYGAPRTYGLSLTKHF
jgi:iron complex outermembrane receptor protein